VLARQCVTELGSSCPAGSLPPQVSYRHRCYDYGERPLDDEGWFAGGDTVVFPVGAGQGKRLAWVSLKAPPAEPLLHDVPRGDQPPFPSPQAVHKELVERPDEPQPRPPRKVQTGAQVRGSLERLLAGKLIFHRTSRPDGMLQRPAWLFLRVIGTRGTPLVTSRRRL
jgi:hypothetical protein